MLLATVLIWSLNFTVVKYVLSHGVHPLAYACVRFGAAALIFAGLTYALEGSFRMGRADLLFLLGAAVVGVALNQLTFVYATKLTTATTVALIFGTLPVMTALISFAAGIERLSSRFWLAALTSFSGVALVALGSHGGISANLAGDLLAVAATATWAAYSVAIVPLMRRYSAYRISAIALLAGTVLLFAAGSHQVVDQDYSFGPAIWAAFVFSTLGPLVLTNVLWFTAISRVGPSRASVFANLQPFLGAIFALLLLSESMTWLQVVGGLSIAAGIVLSRGRQTFVLSPPQE